MASSKITSADKVIGNIKKQLDEALRQKGIMNSNDTVVLHGKYFDFSDLIEVYKALRTMQDEGQCLLKAAENLGGTSGWNKLAQVRKKRSRKR